MIHLLKQLHVAVPFDDLAGKYLDLVLENGVSPEIGLRAEVLDAFADEDFVRISEKLKRRGLRTTLHAPFVDLHPASEDPVIRDGSRSRLMRAFELLDVFTPRSVVCHLGFDPRLHMEDLDAWVNRWVGFMEVCLPLFEKRGVPIMIENTFEWDTEVFERIFEAVPSPFLGFCLDTGHCLAFGKLPWQEWVERLHGRLGQLHLHDNSGAYDDHQAVGQGRFPFRPFLARLAELNLRPLVTLEAHREDWVWISLKNLSEMWPWSDDGET